MVTEMVLREREANLFPKHFSLNVRELSYTNSTNMSSKRTKYTAKFKLQVVDYAEKTNNCAASREFNISEKLVRDWKRLQEKLKAMPKSKCADRGKSCQWPEVEREMLSWIEEQRQSGYAVTRNLIRLQARTYAKKHSINMTASVGWLNRFMKRNNLVLRQKTKISQKLPHDFEDKITSFHTFIINQRKREEYGMANIGNMDETPVWFDMPSTRTVSKCGEKTVLIRTTGHEKSRFTVVLACMADGTRLKPMVIFKRKTIPKENFPPGVVVHCHAKGWMDEQGLKVWINQVWAARPGGLSRTKSLLVWDSFRAHLVPSVKRLLAAHNTDIAVIPGGLTNIVQPLDVSLNKPFKDRMREKWLNWMTDGEKSVPAGGNVRAASTATVTNWVKASWTSLDESMVVKSFKKCGISNAMDGSEDDALWEDGDIETPEDNAIEDEDDDVYDDRVSHDQWNDLFGDSDCENEFEGF